MVPVDDIAGVVLAGGESRRMGRDKALLLRDGVPFVVLIADALRAVFPEVILSANGGAYRSTGLRQVPDLHPGAGPLAGIHAAMGPVRRGHVFVLGCDTPLVTPDLIRAVCSAAEPGRISVCKDGSGLQPLAGVYPCPAAGRLDAYLGSGGRSVAGFLEAEGFLTVDVRSFGDLLRNVNTPGDVQSLNGRGGARTPR